MKRIVCALAIMTVFGAAAYAADERLSSIQLIDKAKELDGKSVIYAGELVTAILNRGEYSWAHVNDGSNTIGVWCVTSALAPVKFVGDFKHKGDIVEVRGTFHRACYLHGGELDIHADAIAIKELGHDVRQWISVRKLILALALLLLSSYIITRFINRM